MSDTPKKRGSPPKSTQGIENHTDLPDDTVTEIVKQKHKRPKRSEMYLPHNEPGEMAQMIRNGMGLMNMPKVDVQNPEAVKQRINEYLEYCIDRDMKPSVESMALAFGINRSTLWKWKEGVESNLPDESRNALKNGYNLMNQLLAQNMADGKINPVAAIFLLKNNHSYKDQTDVVVTPNNPYGTDNPNEVKDKYLEDVGEIGAEGEVK